jgi:predicted dehydrogenase
MAAPVRFAVIGLDHWYSAVPLAQSLAARSDTELVGIAHSDLDRANEVAGKIGDITVTDSGQQFIDDPSIDAIASYVSVDANPEICIAAAAKGKHIISVKPLARTLDEADRIVAAVRDAGVVFLPSESRQRASAQNRQLKKWVTEGRLGRIVSANLSLNGGGLPQSWPGNTDPGWFTDPDRAPGGAWIDHSIYQIDLMRWLLGEEVAAISGRTANFKHPELKFEDYGHAIVEFAGGAIASVEDTWSSPAGGSRVVSTIIGTDGTVSIDSVTGQVSLAGSDGPFEGWTHGKVTGPNGDGIDEFLAAIGGGEHLGTINDAWENLSACRAFYEASESGTIVKPKHL